MNEKNIIQNNLLLKIIFINIIYNKTNFIIFILYLKIAKVKLFK